MHGLIALGLDINIIVDYYSLMSLRFSRLIKGTSAEQDLDLDSKYYLIYGTGSTQQGQQLCTIVAQPSTLLSVEVDPS